MKTQELAKTLYEKAVEDCFLEMKTQFESSTESERSFYKSLNDRQKEAYLGLVRNFIFQGAAGIVSILDGSASTRDGGYIDAKITVDGQDIEDLADYFFSEYQESVPQEEWKAPIF